MRNFLLGYLLLATLPAAAQTVDPTFTSPTSLYQPGALYAMGPAQADGKRVLAGNFTRVNSTATSGLVRLDASGALDQSFSQNVGQASSFIYSITAGRNGQYLLGALGGNLTAGGLSRTELLLLNADGTGDASFDAGAGPSAGVNNADYGAGYTYTMQPDGKVLVGGYFDAFGGMAASGLVRLLDTGRPDASFSVGTGVNVATNDQFVQALAVQANGQILVGGYFSAFAGQPAGGLVRLNADGSRDATLPAVLGANSYVASLTIQPDGRILVTGDLYVNSNYVPLVRLLASGALDTSFDTSTASITFLNDNYQSPIVLQPDGKLVLIGTFNTGSRSNLARLNADGSRDNTFSYQSATDPELIGLQPNGRILLGSPNVNSVFSGTLEATLAQYTSAGLLDNTYTAKIQATSAIGVTKLLSDGTLLAGGTFTEWNGQPVHRLAHLSTTGTLDDAFSTRLGVLPGSVAALAVQADGNVLVGTTAGLRRLAANGTPDASFSQAINSSVTALAMQPDAKILVAGNFYLSTSGTTYTQLLRLTSTGSIDPSFVLTAGSLTLPLSIHSLLLQPDGRVVAGARYNTASYVTRYGSTGAQDASFTPALLTANGYPYAYALARQADGKLLVGGNFTQIGGVARAGLARLTTTGAVDASFALPGQFFGTVNSLAIQPNNRVLLGGTFTPAGSSVGANLARILPDGPLDASFATTATPNSTVRSILVQPDGGIVLAGSFSSINNQLQLALARITAPNVLAVAAPAATAARTTAWPVPAHELLYIAPDPSAQPQLAELLDALGHPVLRQPLTSAAEFTLPTAGLPAGMYLLRVSYATGTVTRQVAVE